MKLEKFKALLEHDQYDITFKEGDFIEYWLNGNQRFALYAVYKFYVEVEYKVSENRIVKLISFEEGKLVDKYAFFRKSND